MYIYVGLIQYIQYKYIEINKYRCIEPLYNTRLRMEIKKTKAKYISDL